MVYVTHIRLSAGGTGHRHINEVAWRNPTEGNTGRSTRAVMVDWISNKGGDARIRDASGREARVGAVQAQPPYLRTYADGVWTDNLLALPHF